MHQEDPKQEHQLDHEAQCRPQNLPPHELAQELQSDLATQGGAPDGAGVPLINVSTSGPTRFDKLRTRRLALFALALVLLVLALGIVYYPLLLPFFISLFFAYLLAPVIRWLEARGIDRAIGSAALVLIGLLTIVFININLLPLLYEEGLQLLQLVPKAMQSLIAAAVPATRSYLIAQGVASGEAFDAAMANLFPTSRIVERLSAAATGLWQNTPVLIGVLINVAVVPILTFFLLRDYSRLSNGFRRLVPRDLTVPVEAFLRKVNWTFHAVIKAQLTVAAIAGVLYTVGFSAINLRYGVLIGIVAGFCRIVPYLDLIVSAVLCLIVIMTTGAGWAKLVAAGIVIMAIQSIDGVFITPKIVGGRVGLHPGVAVMSVLAFGYWLGLYGVLIAIPVVAIAQVVCKAVLRTYYASDAYDPYISVSLNPSPARDPVRDTKASPPQNPERP